MFNCIDHPGRRRPLLSIVVACIVPASGQCAITRVIGRALAIAMPCAAMKAVNDPPDQDANCQDREYKKGAPRRE